MAPLVGGKPRGRSESAPAARTHTLLASICAAGILRRDEINDSLRGRPLHFRRMERCGRSRHFPRAAMHRVPRTGIATRSTHLASPSGSARCCPRKDLALPSRRRCRTTASEPWCCCAR